MGAAMLQTNASRFDRPADIGGRVRAEGHRAWPPEALHSVVLDALGPDARATLAGEEWGTWRTPSAARWPPRPRPPSTGWRSRANRRSHAGRRIWSAAWATIGCARSWAVTDAERLDDSRAASTGAPGVLAEAPTGLGAAVRWEMVDGAVRLDEAARACRRRALLLWPRLGHGACGRRRMTRPFPGLPGRRGG